MSEPRNLAQCSGLSALLKSVLSYGSAEQVSETDAVRGVWRTGTGMYAQVT